MITAGELTELIRIETPTKTENELKEEEISWALDAMAWAKAVEGLGREFVKGDYQAEKKVAFKIRYRSMNSEARVIWQDRAYDIVNVTGKPSEGATWLHCVAIGGAN
ncbi:phage head closure protein [Sphingobium sp. CFD-2]|uniref:phage head closure protein n=1 Tax=Sphingobium sp. CFD-2 TaxID=2878542 RepID=UPI00214B44B1|nr:phage head closure protein [Sphingobium sp. CFD-2]